MPELSRRKFLGTAAAVTGAAAVGLPSGAAEAAPAAKKHCDIRDIKHVVVIMQENRSFDHYFGSLKGVRGFGDRSTIQLPGGAPVWQQPAAAGTQIPWRSTTYRRPCPRSARPMSSSPACRSGSGSGSR